MTSRRTAGVAALAIAATLGAAGLRADVAPEPAWRLGVRASAALLHGDTVYLGGAFTQLYTPSSSQNQFYDPATAQVRPECARSTSASRGINGVSDLRGGLLVVVQPGDAFADAGGPFAPPAGTTIVRIGNNCLWDRGFAAPSIHPDTPGDLSVGVPVPVSTPAGDFILASNAVVGPDGFLRAQVASFNAVSGGRVSFREYPGVAEIGFYGPGPGRAVARVLGTGFFEGAYRLGAVTPGNLDLTLSSATLEGESLGSRTWVRGDTLFRARPAPYHTLEAYDLATLEAREGWAAPAVPALMDLEVVGSRVFLAATVVDGQPVPRPAALALATGVVDSTWQPAALTKRNPDPSGTPYVPVLTELATDGQRLYVSGDFERVAGGDRDGIAAISAATGGLDQWDPAPVVAQPLEHSTGGLLMSRPTGTSRVTRRYLAAIDRATGAARSWNPNDSARVLLHTASPVSAMAIAGGHLNFASATTGELLRADLATADVDQNWRVVVRRAGGQPGVIVAMAVLDNVLYLGGDFDSISGLSIGTTPQRALAAVGTDGALRPWMPVVEGPPDATLVHTLLALGQTIYLGGEFTSVNDQFYQGFGAVSAITGQNVQPAMFAPGNTRIHGLATDGAQIFVTGISFSAPLVAGVSIPGSVPTRFEPTGGAVPQSAAFVTGHLYAGREYEVEARTPTPRAATWNHVVGDGAGLLHMTGAAALVEYFVAVPGIPPGSPTLSSSVSGNAVTLSWVPGEGGTASSYTVLAGSTPGLSDLASIVVRGTTALAVTAPNGTYYVRVVARNAHGTAPPSNEVVVQVGPPPCTLPPAAPGPLAHTTAGFTVDLTWGASATAAAYILDAGLSPGLTNVGSFALGGATSVRVSAPPGTYYARVRATNACGASPPSNEAVVVVDGTVQPPQAPTGLTATVTGSHVSIAWTPPSSGATPSGYWLEAGYQPGAVNAAVAPTTSPLLNVANVPPATYYVRVRAFNAAGAGPATPDIVVTVP